jgi:peptide chain release factor 1
MDIQGNKIILEVRAGAGGDEASIFAGNLVHMYQRYAAKRGWRFSVIDSNQNTLNGYKTFIGKIEGPSTSSGQASVYDELQNESGVHRVQRVPATEKSGRVHTSTASVAVMPVVEPKEMNINPGDLEISFFRSSGPGGQNVNKVETAVRIVHKPTGVVVACQNGRSQSANREEAMSILSSRIWEAQRLEEMVRLGKLRRDQIGSGDRAEKIRTYNFPDDRITDHRIGKKWHNIENILEGNMEPIVKAFSSIGGSTSGGQKTEPQ